MLAQMRGHLHRLNDGHRRDTAPRSSQVPSHRSQHRRVHSKPPQCPRHRRIRIRRREKHSRTTRSSTSSPRRRALTSVRVRYSLGHLFTLSVRPFEQSEGCPQRVGNYRDFAAVAINPRLDQHAAAEGHDLCSHLDRIFDAYVIEPVGMGIGPVRRQRIYARTSIVVETRARDVGRPRWRATRRLRSRIASGRKQQRCPDRS